MDERGEVSEEAMHSMYDEIKAMLGGRALKK